jgi:hypothetical protein
MFELWILAFSMLINCAFVGQRNFDIIEMHGATTKITSFILAIICQTCLAYDGILKWSLQSKTVLLTEILTRWFSEFYTVG